METADLTLCRDVEVGATIVAGPEAYRLRRGQDRSTVGRLQSWLNGLGVRRANGAVARFGTDIYRHRRSRPIKLKHLTGPIESVSGPMIYAGVIGPDFGHQLTQSIGRLWAAAEFPDAELAFVGASPEFTELPGYFIEVIRSLGVTNPMRLLHAAVTVERLVVPRDLCNLHRRPSVDPGFASWLRDHRPGGAVDPDLRVYASRSGLDPSRGQYLQESVLEAALAEEGYLVVRPEAMPVADQIDLYLRAGRLIFADGSAVHLWSLFAHPDQRAAMILRRPADRHIRHWFSGLSDLRVTFHDHRVADFSQRGGASGKSAALLDMKALWRDLRQHGYHDAPADIGTPRSELDRWVEAVQRGTRALDAAPPDLDERSRHLLALRPRAVPSKTA